MFTPSGFPTFDAPGVAEHEHRMLESIKGSGIFDSWIRSSKPKKDKAKSVEKDSAFQDKLPITKSAKEITTPTDDDMLPDNFLARMAMFALAHIALQ
jgi:hypothetical protein